MQAIRGLPPDAAEFHFVGPIPPHLQLTQPNVIYHGPISDTARIQEILDGCDVLVCPSFAEGMPTVVLEGMARGLAILATDVGATSEWVSDANGVLLRSPTVPGLREAMAVFLQMEPQQLHALQLASLEKSKHYTWQRVANATLTVIASKG
jgi:glycosyltransferase involved in cell wall biosynthesis